MSILESTNKDPELQSEDFLLTFSPEALDFYQKLEHCKSVVLYTYMHSYM